MKFSWKLVSNDVKKFSDVPDDIYRLFSGKVYLYVIDILTRIKKTV